MGLQIDNPMTLLSQDLAREFLNSSKPETKYKYFMKGVQLDQLYGDYRILENAHTNIASTLDAKVRDIDEMYEEVKEAEKKFIAIRETENLRAKVELFLRKHAWSQVAEAEKVNILPNYTGHTFSMGRIHIYILRCIRTFRNKQSNLIILFIISPFRKSRTVKHRLSNKRQM